MNLRKRFIKSFMCAGRGLRYAWKHEQNFRIEIAAAVAALLAGFALGINRWEWTVLVLVISFVLMLELSNSSIEALADLVKPRLHEYVELIKDVMAGAVLVVSAAAAVIGLIIFLPHLVK